MKIIQSFWTKPSLTKGELNYQNRFAGGWVDYKYNLMSWALSCLQFKKFYNDVELFTDKKGKELLIDKLQLPYTHIIVELDKLNHYHHDLWAIGKLYTYSLQKEPFLHVDGDAFIWERFSPELENSDLVAQNIEVNFPFYKNSLNEIQRIFLYKPDCMINHLPDDDITAVNAGVIGGNDIEFIQEYTKTAFELINRNIGNLERINTGIFNTIYEQYLFYHLAKERKKNIFFLTENINNKFEGLAEFRRVPTKTKFIHLVGHYKKFKQIGDYLANRLRSDHPEYYYRIEYLLKNFKI